MCLISSSNVSVLGTFDLRFRDATERDEEGGRESIVGCAEEAVEFGVCGERREVAEGGLVDSAGGEKGRGWCRVETIVARPGLCYSSLGLTDRS